MRLCGGTCRQKVPSACQSGVTGSGASAGALRLRSQGGGSALHGGRRRAQHYRGGARCRLCMAVAAVCMRQARSRPALQTGSPAEGRAAVRHARALAVHGPHQQRARGPPRHSARTRCSARAATTGASCSRHRPHTAAAPPPRPFPPQWWARARRRAPTATSSRGAAAAQQRRRHRRAAT